MTDGYKKLASEVPSAVRPVATEDKPAECDIPARARFEFTTRERALRVMLELDRLAGDWGRSATADVGGVPPIEGKRQLMRCARALVRVLTSHGFYSESEPITSQPVAEGLVVKDRTAPRFSKSAVSVSEVSVPGGRRTGGESA